MVAGVEEIIDYLENFGFEDDDIEHLRSLDIYDEGYLEFLREISFSGEVRAIPEGVVIANQVPIFSITAPRIECSIIESALLAMINHQTMIASKASRIVDASNGRPVWDFSLRRLHGVEASYGVARASYIAGCEGTATVAAGKRYGIPTTGTMAHHYVMAFGEEGEKQAFCQFLQDYPKGTTLLVDTYDTLRGVQRAIEAANLEGPERLAAIRLDSGDLGKLATQARVLLDEAGFGHTKILASNDLDEYKLEALREAPIDAFGVGTMLGTSADTPYTGSVYKINLSGETAVMKRTRGKQTDPGAHQVFRYNDRDTIGLRDETLPGTPLLEVFMEEGRRVRGQDDLETIRRRAQSQRESLPAETRRIEDPASLVAERSDKLWELRASLGDLDAVDRVNLIQAELDGSRS
jgi:nicotinate phosphoribosyltransferase